MLVPVFPHSWDISPAQAVVLQRELARKIIVEDLHHPIERVGGLDVAVNAGIARAAVVVMTYPGLLVIEQIAVERPVSFPYVPGLLSFREAPAILDALARLQNAPDVLIFDGQGYAHPRRMGIATHVGILLDHPTIGCAKSCLCGTYEQPAPGRGSYTWLRDRGEIIGAVLRTRSCVKPVFVSVGHRMHLERALEIVLVCGGGYRLPEPTRRAHHLASGENKVSP